MAKTPKSPSLKKVARTYRKSRANQQTNETGAPYWGPGGSRSSRGTGSSTLDYKPKPRAATFGTSSTSGGGTKRLNKAKAK